MNSTEFWKKPTTEQVSKALALLVHPQQRQYFFNRLENPEWIAELKKRGWFENPPPVIQTGDDTVSFPNWAESRYLVRMALHRPEEVLEIVLSIQTDNPSIHQDFVEAALNMPPSLAAKMEGKVRKWIEKSPYFFYPLLGEKIGELVSHLARGQQAAVALKLARALLTIVPAPQQNRDSTTSYRFPSEPRSRLDEWYYNRILEKNIPDLIAVEGERTLTLLCGLLHDAIAAAQSRFEQPDTLIWEDYSYIRHPSIENRTHNAGYQDITSYLIIAIRETAKKTVEADNTKLPTIVALLKKWHWRAFHRLAIDLIRRFPVVSPALVAEVLTNRDYFDFPTFHQDFEYALLVHEQFGHLSESDQQTILDWIAHPKLTQLERDDPEAHSRWTRRWQIRKLVPLKEHLVTEWQQKHSELVREAEAVELADLLPSGIQIHSAAESPKTDVELAAMEIEALVEFLKTWKPACANAPESQSLFDEPSSEGLAWTLQHLIESEPMRYAAAAEQFRGLSATYLTCVLRGFRKLLSQEHWIAEVTSFPWISIVSLCQNVVDVSLSTRTPETASQVLRSEWREARRAVAETLGLGLSAQKPQILMPLTLREQVWSVLHSLTTDPDPTPDYETQYNHDSNQQIINLSINTVRGEAMHAVMRYALWLRRDQEVTVDRAITSGFDQMPEVRQVLEEHLDPLLDPSLAIRSVYGQWFPWLALLDEAWTSQQIPKIFPHDPMLKSLRQIAWDGYITFCSPYSNALKLLAKEYEFAIEQLDLASEVRSTRRDPNEALVQHLMTFYWQGYLSLEDKLLTRFYFKAPVAIQKYAIEYVGRSLWQTKGAIDPQIQEWLIALWQFRLTAVQNVAQSDTAELGAYGWWFAAAKFDADWAIVQLKIVLELGVEIEADHFVIERLAECAETHLACVVDCLRRMLEQDQSDWNMHGWNDEVRQILSLALQQETSNLQQTARNMINTLGRRGYWEFRNLLALVDQISEFT